MKIPFDKLDKAFENRLRLQIMSVLVANERYDFNSLKDLLNITDGNLASHLKGLEKEEYILVNKSFLGPLIWSLWQRLCQRNGPGWLTQGLRLRTRGTRTSCRTKRTASLSRGTAKTDGGEKDEVE